MSGPVVVEVGAVEADGLGLAEGLGLVGAVVGLADGDGLAEGLGLVGAVVGLADGEGLGVVQFLRHVVVVVVPPLPVLLPASAGEALPMTPATIAAVMSSLRSDIRTPGARCTRCVHALRVQRRTSYRPMGLGRDCLMPGSIRTVGPNGCNRKSFLVFP
jgi:hypothetical protein